MLDAPGERRILVVDDDPEILDLLATMIATEGHVADTAGDGRAGLEKIAACEYGLILCDITKNSVPIISKPFKRAQISEAIKGKEF